MKTLTDKNTISAELLRQDAGAMSGLLGGLTAGCRLDVPQAEEVLDRWIESLRSEFGDGGPEGRQPLARYRKLFRLFVEHATRLLDTAEGKP